MKQSDNIMILLFCAAALAGCSADNEVDNEIPSPIPQQWKAVAYATIDSIDNSGDVDEPNRRAWFWGGNTARFAKVWDEGDYVQVYNNDVKIGTLTPNSEYYATKEALLEGTMTGAFEVGDVVDLYMPAKRADDTGQDGTVYKLSNTYSYQYYTGATVVSKTDSKLSLSNINMYHRQHYLRFMLLNEEGTVRLHPTRFELHAISGGHIAQSVEEDGTVVPCDVLTVLPVEDNGEYAGELFVALLNDADTKVNYRIKAHVGDDIYVGPVDIAGQNAFGVNSRTRLGSLDRVVRRMRLTSSVSSLTIADIASRTFTGSPIVPGAAEVVVKDGETPLVQGTDYSYAFTNNTNVGEATVTITGLAMDGEKAQTKWLGEKTKTFIITKATPVVEISSTKMELTNHEGGTTSSTRVVARVFVDNNANGTWDTGTDYDITALCTVAYTSGNTGVCTVNATTGQVTAVGPGTATITATVQAAANWNTAQTTYEVEVRGDVRGGNSVNPWGDGGTTDDDTHTGY